MIHYRKDVLDEIEKINRLFPEPQCYLVALLLSSEFQGEIWYNSDHCITKISGVYYDKGGVVIEECRKKQPDYLPLSKFGMDIKKGLVEALVKNYKK
ncbi:MAG: hypothetical protein WBA57_04170 [Elainellaceae cyanobacterium]